LVEAMIVDEVWTGVGLSNLKNFRIRPGFKNFWTGAELESEKVTPPTSDMSVVTLWFCL